MDHLIFRGIQSYEGHIVYINDRDDRTQGVKDAFAHVIESRRLIERSGIEVGAVSGGATSTYNITGVIDGVDEIQAGTYATMDWRYHELTPEFDIALTLLTTVISTPAPGRAVLDTGVKGAGAEFGLPRIKGHPTVEIPFFLAEEHTAMLNVPDWHVGDVVHFVPSHSCTTCNLHRWFYVHEDGKVVDVWPIEASGRLA
jgi:D-serine deaminase-like pyridoxal phosphate-dependent protein